MHSDHLGTPRRITNESGQPVWQWAYSAYGDNAAQVLAAATPGFAFNPRFPGQYFDSESGKHYNYFRTYDPKTGRYTSADPIGLEGGWNRFAYVGGNSLSFVDPKGLCPICLVPLVPAACYLSPGCRDLFTPRPRPGPVLLDPGYPPGNWPPPPLEPPSPPFESWPKDDKNFCIRTYGNCIDYGWGGNFQACLDRCMVSQSVDWPFDICKPPKMQRDMCEIR
ncbi:RHS repeat domain-containing protein [Hydrogenophaga aromaticivorans]|uniref:RHS repeat domain-containing protein n=1 Tax=Hydrogenophaga aromaticivorans TaxID=2610898 RepID=UPI003CD0DC52